MLKLTDRAMIKTISMPTKNKKIMTHENRDATGLAANKYTHP